MRMEVGVDFPPGAIKTLASGGAMWAPFTATFTSDRVRVTITVDIADGRPVCRHYEVDRIDDVADGLELMTTEVARGINLRALMAHGCADVALQPLPDGTTYQPATSLEAVEAVVGELRRRRSPTITDKQLRGFAAAYRKGYTPGAMAEFAKDQGFSERHAWRLLKLARERGFLPQSKKGA
jgi:hypothetical protein